MNKKAVLSLLIVFTLFGCTPSSEIISNPSNTYAEKQTNNSSQTVASPVKDPEETIRNAVMEQLETKVQSVQKKDLSLYLTTITETDPYYWNEQKRWFTEMTKEGVENLVFTIRGLMIEDDSTVIAIIQQCHFYKQDFAITYPLRFIKENDKWKDAGYDFEVHQTDRYTIKYMPGETKVSDFEKMIDTSYDNLAVVFAEKPDPNFEIKLFHDRELLRQRTIPTIGWLFTGWGEANESLKLYTGHPSLEPYYGTVQHELVHHITMRICNNNLPGWIADGIALQYGNYALEGGNAITLGYATKEQVRISIDDLENEDIWEASDQKETWDWYNASQMVTEYIIEKYGHDQLMALFYEAGKKPYNENVMNMDFTSQNNDTMGQVLQSVLGISKSELTEDYWNWLDQNY